MGDEIVIAALEGDPGFARGGDAVLVGEVAVAAEGDPNAVSEHPVTGDAVAVPLEQQSDLGVARHPVARHPRLVDADRVKPDIGVPRELVANDAVMAGVEHRHPGVIDGEPVTDDPALAEAEVVGAEDREPVEVIVRRGDSPQRVLLRPADQDPKPELPELAVHDHEPGVAARVVDARVADLPPPALPDELVVTVDRVPVEVEGNVVGADHDPVVRAVDQVAVKLRVGLDLVAAVHGAGERFTRAEFQTQRECEHEDRPGCAADDLMPPLNAGYTLRPDAASFPATLHPDLSLSMQSGTTALRPERYFCSPAASRALSRSR